MQKKFLTKFNTHFCEKITLPKVDTEGIYRNIIKAIYDKPTANIILSGKKLETLPLIRTKTKKSTLTTTVQHSLEVLVMAIREEKEKKKKVESRLDNQAIHSHFELMNIHNRYIFSLLYFELLGFLITIFWVAFPICLFLILSFLKI